jgi:hypothetical protein
LLSTDTSDYDVPSSRMTLSPNTFSTMAPFERSTILVRISLIARDRALTSIAQMPSITGGRPTSMIERSDWDPLGDGEEVRVTIELERGELRSD